MKFNLLGENNYNLDPINTIFLNRGISNVQELLSVNEKNVTHYSKLKNIEKATSCLLSHIDKDNKIFIQVDSDCDGFCSSAILINYLKRIYPKINIEWRLQEGKQHGVKVKDIPSDTNLVIIPDAGSNQIKEHRELKEKGIDVIVLDHHECEEESKYAIVVNNQISPEYMTKGLSGAGIVYKFCEALDDKLNTNHADHYLDLVAVGNIGDMMDLRELETRYYVKKGLLQINNPLLEAIISQQEFSMKGIVNIHNVAFYVVPLINAAVRAANLSEKRDMMKSFLESKELVYYKRKDTYETIQVSTARNLTNIRNRQNKPKDKGVTLLEEKIVKEDLLKEKVIVLDVTDILDKNLTGLVANQISRKFKRPSLLLRSLNDKTFGGSARGFEKGEINNFREFLIESQLFNFCEGHSNAFGIEILKERIPYLKTYFNNNLLQDIELDCYEVDFVVDGSELDNSLVYEIAKYRDEWGSTIEEPKIAVTNIPFAKENISLVGKKIKNLKLFHNNTEFIKFYFKEDQFDEMFSDGETFYMNLVGKCKLNEWEGNVTPQLSIEGFEITDILYF